MKSVKREQHALWLPLIILGYLETLRRASFYAFGWTGRGQALAIVSTIVIIQICIDYLSPSRFKKAAAVVTGLSYIGMVWVANRSISGERSVIGEFLFGLPNFNLGIITPFYYATFCFFVVFFYALLVFLLTAFILERKNVSEVFAAGTVLLLTEIIASDEGIMGYVFLNAVFAIVLLARLHLVQLQEDPRVRTARGTGINAGTWTGAALVLAVLIATTGALLPSGRPKADYASAGQNLVQQVMGGRAQINVKQSEGYYDVFWDKMQHFKFKGEAPVEDTPVMYVKSPRPGYWRGESADFYNGGGWENTTTAKQVKGRDFDCPYSPKVQVDQIDQVFSLTSGMSSQVLFTSGSPACVEIAGAALSRDEGDNIYTTNTGPGISYKVISYIPEREPQKLKHTSQEYPVNIRSLYLQLPDNMPDRVRKLARQLTRDAHSPFDKTRAIENYLSGNYPYDLSVCPPPDGRDVVDYFLFDLKKGYCTYHSTAMVVMLRSVGIPARWVKGFTTGTENKEMGVYQVDMSDAHAWVEVYFSDYGWLPFEPTSSFILPGRTPAENKPPVQEESPASALAVPQVSPNQLLQDEGRGFPWGVVVTVLILAGTALAFYLRRIKNIFRFGSGDKIRDTYLSFLNLLAYKGYPKNASQTPMEYAGGLADKFPADFDDIMAITEAYMRDKYTGKSLSRSEVEEVRHIFRRLTDKLLGKSRD